ncbi:MAG: hypothetical protein MJ223_00460 [Mycoplasmoidaceae bacterium]|nr:hypothetical protein [Mycoplasmoidaceae bacterium]
MYYPIANAIKLMNEILYSFSQDKAKISLIGLNGGNAMNALPSNVEALIQMNPKDVPEFKKHCKKFVESSIKLAQGLDDKAKFSIQLASKQEKKACSIEESEKLFLFYAFVPTGIFRMDICLKHIFSSGNIGKVRTEKGVLSNQFCSRSFYLPEFEKQYKDICYLGKLVGMGNFYREITILS